MSILAETRQTTPPRALPGRVAPAQGPPVRDCYCPFPMTNDARGLRLTTSSMRLSRATVSVRHGRRTGSDTATILLHGAAGSWTTWTPLLTAADSCGLALADLVIPDLPGWGDSPFPADGPSRSIEATAAVVAEIARALGYTSWTVIGHSLGGFVALELAASETQATVSVGLVSATTYSVIDTVRHPVARCAVLPGYGALLTVMRALSGVGRVGDGLIRLLHRTNLLRLLAAPLFHRPRLVHASVVDALATELRPQAFAVASALAGGYDADRLWSRIQCKVRAVQGDTDIFVAATDAARLHAVIPGFEHTTVHGSGHFAHVEQPFATLRHLLPGLRRSH
ncbi:MULTISPECIES: alpha/beta hydrolase [Cryobacterium]|uniref:Alpha/beta hydrolase n=1 Tax=Cryobacterium breve TaxID=1259258 RepID=A0ABY2IZ72_9MICO|nr:MULTISPECIES: alpha/beta hydrolase [Cryobacterium]TFC90553.1 alpha/beta hydrolase [Cryobacterium sp. TmT3-12]TFC95653.1 alpha/beta hydrolase [Cryobacterium breve]